MLPTLKPGQLMLFIRWFSYRAGDIVMVRHEGKEKVKRIKEKNKEEFYLIADNNDPGHESHELGWIPKDEIIAKAIFS